MGVLGALKPSGLCAQDLHQFATLIHLHHDVGAADEFALDVKLGNGRPVAVFLDALANLLIFQNIHGFDRLGIDATCFQNLDGAAGKPALWKAGVTFHEQQDVVALDELVDALLRVAHDGFFQ